MGEEATVVRGDTGPRAALLNKVTKEFLNLLDKTNRSDPKEEDVAALRKCLRKNPELWRIAGDVAMITMDDLVQKVTSSPAMRESLYQGWIEMLRELGYPDATQLERLLIDQVVLCWLRLNYLEYQYSNLDRSELLISQAAFWEKRLSASQRRFLRACEALARVRRLLRPKVAQVNIGAQQVNIAQRE